MKIERYADSRRSQETDRTAPQALLQDMLQVWWQEPDICDEVPEMPQRPDEAEEQDAGRQEVKGSPPFNILNAYPVCCWQGDRVYGMVSEVLSFIIEVTPIVPTTSAAVLPELPKVNNPSMTNRSPICILSRFASTISCMLDRTK
jgi:hypothetical protein